MKEDYKNKDKEYYWDHFEEIMVNKIDNNENIAESELRELLEFEIERSKGDSRRWTQSVFSIIKLCDRFFELDWEKGLTEYQENEFYYQPYEVKKCTYEKTITVTDWVKVDKNKK